MATANDEKVLDQVGSIWKFLDTMSVSNPEEYNKFIDKVMKEGSANNLGPPVPKIVIQTEKKPAVIPNYRYFINISEWKQLPKPESKVSPVPIVSSKPRKEIIEKEHAVVIDVVMNPIIFEENLSNHLAVAGIIELVLKYIESKETLLLSRKYHICTEKYKGNQDNLLTFMCPSALTNSLSGTKTSLFEQLRQISSEKTETDIKKQTTEVNPDHDKENSVTKNLTKSDGPLYDPVITARTSIEPLTEVKTKAIKNTKTETKKLKSPKVEMIVNKELEDVELTIYLPEVNNVQECDLNLTENQQQLQMDVFQVSPKTLDCFVVSFYFFSCLTPNCLSLLVVGKYQVRLNLPVDINVDKSKAKFVKDQKILLITAPFK